MSAKFCRHGGAAGGGKTVGLILGPLPQVSRVANFAAVFSKARCLRLPIPEHLSDESLTVPTEKRE
jgi:hypothetical protein